MLNSLFGSVLSSSSTTISFANFFVCITSALFIGMIISFMYSYKSRSSNSFVVTLVVIPAVVTMVIMLVNGSIGTGIAVAGTFSLVRFRSAPGTAKEIAAIFLAMTVGLACGMGYILFALIFSVIISLVIMFYSHTKFGELMPTVRNLIITIPEDLDYSEIFEDIFDEYTESRKLMSVKTTNMGSLYKLTYEINLNNTEKQKEFIDDLRCRNGNLEIILSRPLNGYTDL